MLSVLRRPQVLEAVRAARAHKHSGSEEVKQAAIDAMKAGALFARRAFACTWFKRWLMCLCAPLGELHHSPEPLAHPDSLMASLCACGRGSNPSLKPGSRGRRAR